MDTKTTSVAGEVAELTSLPYDVAALLALGEANLVADPQEQADGSRLYFLGEHVKVHAVPALNPALPAFVKASETFVEPASMTDYITKFKSSTALCRASLSKHEIVAVLDYHGDARMGSKDDATPGRCAHTATLQCPWDADYAKWRAIFGKPIAQDALVEFIDDMVHTISQPAAADLLEAISNIEIDRVVKFKSRANPRNGTVAITYTEDDGGGEQTVQLPGEIVIVTAIFQGGPATELKAKLRYVMEKGQLAYKVVVPGIDVQEREAFRSIGEHLRADTGTPVFYIA